MVIHNRNWLKEISYPVNVENEYNHWNKEKRANDSCIRNERGNKKSLLFGCGDGMWSKAGCQEMVRYGYNFRLTNRSVLWFKTETTNERWIAF